MAKGKHVLIDCWDVPEEICLDDKLVLNTMAKAAELAGATVVSQTRYKFGYNSPPGFTSVCLLDESHVSCHTYGDDRLMAFDCFTCGTTDPENVWNYIRDTLNIENYKIIKVDRFVSKDD